MNAQRKKAAVTKYGKLGLSKEELIEVLAQDEKEYNTDEIQELAAAILGSDSPEAPKHFKEYEVKIVDGKEERLKVRRACVKISDNEAEVLNAGVLHGGNNYGVMYFKD